MTQLQHIEAEVSALPTTELRRFRTWFNEFDARCWDQDIETDIDSGKLNALAAEALADYGANKCRTL